MYHQNESDETLVMLTLAGEQYAYEALVTRYQKAVIASAITITKNHFNLLIKFVITVWSASISNMR